VAIGRESVRLAMARSSAGTRPDLALRALGVDASRGGDDQSGSAKMYGN